MVSYRRQYIFGDNIFCYKYRQYILCHEQKQRTTSQVSREGALCRKKNKSVDAASHVCDAAPYLHPVSTKSVVPGTCQVLHIRTQAKCRKIGPSRGSQRVFFEVYTNYQQTPGRYSSATKKRSNKSPGRYIRLQRYINPWKVHNVTTIRITRYQVYDTGIKLQPA